MFNGPRFQTVTALDQVGSNGLTATLTVFPKDDLFASLPEPQLLTDPCLIDGAGQLLCVWTMTQGRYVLPTGIGKLEIYRPSPPPGTEVPVRLAITRFDPEHATVYADLEIEDGEGYVWMRIQNWTDRVAPVSVKFARFQRMPTRYLFADDRPLDGLPPGYFATTLSEADLGLTTSVWLSRLFLTAEEIAAMDEMMGVRRRQFLLGRVAAKDAVRAWVAGGAENPMLHPAQIELDHEPAGRPVVVPQAAMPDPPHLSISHTDNVAVALAGPTPLGIDIEPLSRQTEQILADFARPEEIALLDPLRSAQPDEAWPTRLWCGKEAAGKALGTGLNGQALDYQLTAASPDGRMTIVHRPTGQELTATTLRDGDAILAYSIV